MRFILFGIIFLLISYLAANLFVKLDAKTLARRAKPVGITLAVALALFFFATGRVLAAKRVLAAAFAFLGASSPFSGWSRGPADTFDTDADASGRTSKVRTSMIEMLLNHDTGAMDGTVVAGRFAGHRVGDLDLRQLSELRGECLQADDQSAAVLEAYLDRNHADWRSDSGFQNTTGGGDDARSRGGIMSVDEALEVLGLNRDAGPDEIIKAHRRLMKQYHPDQGGSDYLASKINEAKDILLEGR